MYIYVHTVAEVYTIHYSIKPCIAGIQGPYTLYSIQTVSGVYIYNVRGINYSIIPCIAGIQGPYTDSIRCIHMYC